MPVSVDVACSVVFDHPVENATIGRRPQSGDPHQVTPGLTSAELARVVGVTPQAITPLVAKLLERGWLERRRHPRHASVQELHLTDSGRSELATADRIMVHLDHHLRSSLGDREYRKLRDLLDQVIEHLPAWNPPDGEAD